MFTDPSSSSSLLALVTTAHLALAAVRNHRRLTSAPVSSLAVVSFALCVLPWVLPSLAGLGLGLAVHGVWFAACELLTPKRVQVPEGMAARTRPAASSDSRAADRSMPAARSAQAPPESHATPAQAPQPKGFVQVPVLAIFDESPTIKTIRVARPEGFAFEAGQFLTVRVRVDGHEHARCYSISSAPEVSGYLEISVKRQGIVSDALHASSRPGGMLWIKRPLGAFRYPTGDDRPLVLLGGGIGITPLMSMLRHAVSTEPARPVTLIYSAHAEQDFAFRDELSAAARRHPQLKVYLASSSGSTKPYIYSGRIDETLLRTTVPDVARSIVLICGPHAMIEGTKTLLGTLGVPAAQIRYEVFQAAVAASAKAHAADVPVPALVPAPVGIGAAGLQARAVVASARSSASPTRRVLCARSRAELSAKPGQTLLEAAEEAGIVIDSICRAGVCGTCRVQVTSGHVDCDSTSLDADERADGFVLACVSTPQTDCTVNA